MQLPAAVARNDLVKAMHCALLRLCGLDVTRAFWEAHPLGALTLRELLEHLWDGTRSSPVVWHSRVQHDLEHLLAEQRIHAASFMEEVMLHAGGKSWLRASDALSWLTPLLPALFRWADPYQMMLHSVTLTTRHFTPTTTFRQVGRTRRGGDRRSAVMLLSYPDLLSGAAVPIDNATFTASSIVVAPELFRCPPFSRLEELCDARSAQQVAWEQRCELRGELFFLNGTRIGHCEDFEHFCRAHGLDLTRHALPTRQVVVMERPYHCPVRDREVLKVGCAYGAPVHLFRFTWPTQVQVRPREALQTLIEETVALHQAQLDESVALHHRLLAQLERVVRVRFTHADDGISLEGSHLCRGVAARILRHCLHELVDTGREEFTLRELKRDPTLVSHPKNTGIEVRLARLRSQLAKRDAGLQIEMLTPGSFRLRCAGRPDFREL